MGPSISIEVVSETNTPSCIEAKVNERERKQSESQLIMTVSILTTNSKKCVLRKLINQLKTDTYVSGENMQLTGIILASLLKKC